VVRHGKISFVSKSKKRDFASVSGKTYFINKKGMFKSRFQAITGKSSVLHASDQPEYRNSWNFNPLTGTLMEAGKPKPKPSPAVDFAKQRELTANYTKNYYLNLAGTFAMPYKAMLEKSYCGPDCYSTMVNNAEVQWKQDTSANVLFNEFETVVHESVHLYNNSFATPGSFGYLVVPGIEISVVPTQPFRSSEVKWIAPADAGEKIFRYNTYLSDSSIVSANTIGIYGLMDEFSAYNNGVRACVVAAQNAMMKGDTAKAAGFIAQASGTYFAYYEFNLFIAWYIHTAKASYPEKYKELMANTNLRVAYTLIDANFKENIDNMKRTGDILQGKTGNDYFAFNEKQYTVYPKKLLEKEKIYLDAFRVKGVTQGNYFTFIN
jgi:hypothetical protein